MQITKELPKEEKWISNFIEIIKPEYITLQIIPHTSNRNYDTELIAKTIASMYKVPWQRFNLKKSGRYTYKLSYYEAEKSSFIIDISKTDAKFYLLVPKRLKGMFIEKCKEIWKRIEINEVGFLPSFHGENYHMGYTKEDALSLKINKKSNEPLNNIINVMDILEGDESIKLLYNFIPLNQNRWKGIFNETIKKVKNGIPIEKNKFSLEYILISAVNIFCWVVDLAFTLINEIFGGGERKKENYTTDRLSRLSKTTLKKEDETVLGTQIIINVTAGKFIRRENNYGSVIGESFKVLEEDNSLSYRKLKNEVRVEDYRIKGADVNTTSTGECNNFIQIPGRELLEKHDIETKSEVLESPPPKELQEGDVTLGECLGSSKNIKGYLPTDYNSANLALVMLSPQGGGKTTLIGNIARSTSNVGESNIILDYIKNCELANDVQKVLNPAKVIDLDLSKQENFQSLAFNEISYTGKNEFKLFEVANMKAEQTMAFIDAANIEGEPLSGRMRRYLSAASNIVYLRNDTSIGDVIKCLKEYKQRIAFIEYAKTFKDQNYLSEFISTLEELHEVETIVDKKSKEVISKEIVGTKDSKIEGILDRANLIQENIYIRYMLYMKPTNNINFIDAMEQGKTILIKMPENKYYSRVVKNVLVTFFTSKIILATKLRGALHEKPSRCNVFYDELSQAPTSEHEIAKVLSQLRKFGTKIIISAHYLDQLNSTLKKEIKASGASYMLIQGADKKNFEELKEELAPYELEDLLRLKKFHSLNLVRYSKGYARFITKLPPPVTRKESGLKSAA